MIIALITRLLVIGLLITFLGCGNSVSNSGDNEIMRLEYNNRWIGSLVTYSYDGIQIDSVDFSYRIFDSSVINSSNWYHLEYIYDNTDTTDSEILLQNGEGGLWSRLNCAPAPCQAYFFAKYPSVKNDTFFTVDTINHYARVISVDTTITVPAGTFTCNAYLWSSGIGWADYFIYYLSPNIGFVKKEIYGPGPADGAYVRQAWFLDYYRL